MTTQTHPPGQRAIVLGAGVVGVACASALQREGFSVTVVDRSAPGEACSLGNAGHLGTASVVPLATPGILAKVPAMLCDPLSPLAIAPSYLLRKLPWFVRLALAARPERVEATAHALAHLLAPTSAAFAPLLREAQCESLVDHCGLLHVFENEATWAGAQWGYNLRRRLGIAVQEMGPVEVRELEPRLRCPIAGGVMLPDVAIVRDPLELTRRLINRTQQAGARFVQARVNRLVAERGLVRAVHTDREEIRADVVVLALGAWSEPFARAFGASVPLAAERGYHIMLDLPAPAVRQALLLVDRRVAVTPMRMGLRLTSMAQFDAPDAPPDYARAQNVFGPAQAALDLSESAVRSRWMGPRPSTPDSRPVIGRAPRAKNLLLAFGHGHLGMTLAAITAELIADLAIGRPARLPLEPFSPTRYGVFRW